MEDFKRDLALLCFNNGITLEKLKECVNNWSNEVKDKKDGDTPVINLEKMVEGFKYICTLDGKGYYLSEDTYLSNVDWHTAKRFAKEEGEGWELPSREVLDQMFMKRKSLGISENEWLWSGEESTATDAWTQHFEYGYQLTTHKTSADIISVRPVYVTDSFEW